MRSEFARANRNAPPQPPPGELDYRAANWDERRLNKSAEKGATCDGRRRPSVLAAQRTKGQRQSPNVINNT